MTHKYKIKPGYEKLAVAAAIPPYKRKNGGLFILAHCTQKDLKYLHDVVQYNGVVVCEDKTNEAYVTKP